MLPDPRDLRIHVYDVLLDRGRPPSASEIARHFRVNEGDAKRAIANLKIGKTVMPHPRTSEVWMAGPFASESTPYKVTGKRTTWFANCAWDMFGVAMIAREWVTIDTVCGDCGEAVRLSADPESPSRDDLVVHFLVPARRWYDDLAYT